MFLVFCVALEWYYRLWYTHIVLCINTACPNDCIFVRYLDFDIIFGVLVFTKVLDSRRVTSMFIVHRSVAFKDPGVMSITSV